MFKIKPRTILSIFISKIIIKLSKLLFKGGSNFPGNVALKIDKDILGTIADKYTLILITGTNGKTTTTSMLFNMLNASGNNVITNNTGANMYSGIVSCFIENYSFKKSSLSKYAVIEVDEANLKFVTEYTKPEIIVITNLFRDQLDRYGEVYTTLNKILEGITKSPSANLILNGDESLLGDLKDKYKTIYYGFNCGTSKDNIIDINSDSKFCKICKAPYKYNYLTYNHLGNYYCDKCGYKRPVLDYFVDNIVEVTCRSSKVIINGKEIFINQPGTYNIYNALCAITVAKTLGIEDIVIANSLKSQNSCFGRQETVNIEGKKVKIILVKNPSGYDQSIGTITLDNSKKGVVFLLNDNYADGRDVSWIWDVNFEKLCNVNINKVIISGIRLYDMATRLKIAGLNQNNFSICKSHDDLLKEIINYSDNTIYVLATYTAMMSLRKFLYNKKYIKKIW